MQSIHVEIPDKIADELNRLVSMGWFQSTEEAIRVALMEYLRRNKTDLHERFQREDVEWAISQMKNKPS